MADAVLSADLKAKVLPLISSSRLSELPLPPFPRLLFALWGVLVTVEVEFFLSYVSQEQGAGTRKETSGEREREREREGEGGGGVWLIGERPCETVPFPF